MSFSITARAEFIALERMIYTGKFVVPEDDAFAFLGSSVIAEIARRLVAADAEQAVAENNALVSRQLESWLRAEAHPEALARVQRYLLQIPGWDEMDRDEQTRIVCDALSPLRAEAETLDRLRSGDL